MQTFSNGQMTPPTGDAAGSISDPFVAVVGRHPAVPASAAVVEAEEQGRNIFICACFVTMLASSESSTSLPAATMAAQMHISLNEA